MKWINFKRKVAKVNCSLIHFYVDVALGKVGQCFELLTQILLEAYDVDIDPQPLLEELNERREVYISSKEYNSFELIASSHAIDVSSENLNNDGNIDFSLDFIIVLCIALAVAAGEGLPLETLLQELDTTLLEVFDELLVSLFLG